MASVTVESVTILFVSFGSQGAVRSPGEVGVNIVVTNQAARHLPARLGLAWIWSFCLFACFLALKQGPSV